MIMLELEDMGLEVTSIRGEIWDIDAMINEEEAGIRGGVTRVGRDQSGKDLLSRLISFEGVEDIPMNVFGVDFLESLVDNWL